MKVIKFGGSSVADYTQMLSVFDIVKNTEGKKIIVLSACQSITNKLEQAAILAANKNLTNAKINKDTILKSIKEHHINILKSTLQKYLNEAMDSIYFLLNELHNILDGISLLNELTNATKDSVLAFGELLSTQVFCFICKEKGIDNTLLDARNLIYTDDNYNNASPIFPLCSENIIKEYEKIKTDLVITQGFIASYYDSKKENNQQKTTTLGRGGSDYSASIIGAILDAEEIQIWTDVNGVLSADPRYYENTFTIKQMSFAEIKDLSFWGAKVLHPKTILPAIEKNINIKVLNTFNPENEGTLITSHQEDNQYAINSIIVKEDCILYVNNSKNVDKNLFNDVLYSGYCNGNYIYLLDKKNIFESGADKNNYLQCSTICICGANLGNNSILFANFFSKLSFLKEINILQIIFGFSFNSILLVVGKCDIHKIADQIHNVIVKLK